MEAVIDTNIVHHTLRRPKTGAPRDPSLLVQCAVKHGLVCVADRDRALLDEWRRTAGDEPVKQLVIQLTDRRALRLLPTLGRVPNGTLNELRALYFDDTIDKLILRIAVSTTERAVISEDSDFWDPSDTSRPGKIGDERAPVARLLKEHLGITVMPLVGLLRVLGAQAL
jgi:hypothetical protein